MSQSPAGLEPADQWSRPTQATSFDSLGCNAYHGLSYSDSTSKDNGIPRTILVIQPERIMGYEIQDETHQLKYKETDNLFVSA